jgi:hypothetical protein
MIPSPSSVLPSVASGGTPDEAKRNARLDDARAKFDARALTTAYCDKHFVALLSDALNLRADLAAARSLLRDAQQENERLDTDIRMYFVHATSLIRDERLRVFPNGVVELVTAYPGPARSFRHQTFQTLREAIDAARAAKLEP